MVHRHAERTLVSVGVLAMRFNGWEDIDDGKRECPCGESFTIFHHERQFYEKKGLQLPKRCKACRQERRMARDQGAPTWP